MFSKQRRTWVAIHNNLRRTDPGQDKKVMQVRGTRTDNVMPGLAPRARQSKTASLSLYAEPPAEEITVDEFEIFALDRLQLLRNMEQARMREGTGADSIHDDRRLHEKLRALEAKHMPLRQAADHFASDRRKDVISHYILRLAYSQTEELRRWFISQECHLLRYRVDQLSEEERANFMSANGIDFEQLGAEEKARRRDKLVGLTDVVETNFGTTIFYRVPFQQALNLISSRSVYVEAGCAFVPLSRVVSLIVTRFRMNLSKALAEASTMFEDVSTDSRIGPLLRNMNKMYTGRDFSKSGTAIDKLTPDKIDLASELNMPLCMKNLHSNLRKDHKLKHWGRLQYGLFLKGAGVTMEDAMIFWESHFTKSMGHDQFMKNYSYTFRHMYGKEGARKNYTPYSCMKIIMGAPPETGAFHGCPYRHSSDTQLLAQLQGLKLGGQEVSDIVKMAKTSNYQLACQRHFDAVHPNWRAMNIIKGDGAANHPNQWFLASVEYHKAKAGGTTSSQLSNTFPSATDVTSNEGATDAMDVRMENGHGSDETVAAVQKETLLMDHLDE